MAKKLQNISIREFKLFLLFHGLNHIRTSSGHEVWSRQNLLRPVIFQIHIDLIPPFIIKNNLRTMNLKFKDLLDYLENKKTKPSTRISSK